ncbi:hypothetical protein PJI16_04140 [Nitrospira sp. MA-1]|nr:hypothetical protein [Nitrospira sp. MA-1]
MDCKEWNRSFFQGDYCPAVLPQLERLSVVWVETSFKFLDSLFGRYMAVTFPGKKAVAGGYKNVDPGLDEVG